MKRKKKTTKKTTHQKLHKSLTRSGLGLVRFTWHVVGKNLQEIFGQSNHLVFWRHGPDLYPVCSEQGFDPVLAQKMPHTNKAKEFHFTALPVSSFKPFPACKTF